MLLASELCHDLEALGFTCWPPDEGLFRHDISQPSSQPSRSLASGPCPLLPPSCCSMFPSCCLGSQHCGSGLGFEECCISFCRRPCCYPFQMVRSSRANVSRQPLQRKSSEICIHDNGSHNRELLTRQNFMGIMDLIRNLSGVWYGKGRPFSVIHTHLAVKIPMQYVHLLGLLVKI